MPQRREQRLVRTSEPGLSVEPKQRFEQCRTPTGIEMRRYLVEQQQRGFAANRPLQRRMSEHDRDQQRLLLAGRGEFGSDSFVRQFDGEIRPMGTDYRPASLRIALPVDGECGCKLSF